MENKDSISLAEINELRKHNEELRTENDDLKRENEDLKKNNRDLSEQKSQLSNALNVSNSEIKLHERYTGIIERLVQ